jgi:hypothetical protein
MSTISIKKPKKMNLKVLPKLEFFFITKVIIVSFFCLKPMWERVELHFHS